MKKLPSGLYEQLVTHELAGPDPVPDLDDLRPDVAVDLLARHVHDAARRARRAARRRPPRRAGRPHEPRPRGAGPSRPGCRRPWRRRRRRRLGTGRVQRPGIPLRHSELIVNGPHDLRVGREIARELPSADGVDLLMSFVKWSGFVELRDAIAALQPHPLRVLTTTYLGVTDPEALDALRDLGAEVRVTIDGGADWAHANALVWDDGEL